jgi:pimeloyl-ACP methyl ester carboxylesterase
MTPDASQAVPRRSGFATNRHARPEPVTLCYEEFGAATDPAVLLIMGWSAQMLFWPTAFCEQLAAQGFRVIRFDNRDIGESTKFRGKKPRPIALSIARFVFGKPSAHATYTLPDLAQDAIALLDELGIAQAHIVGASMGGMIGQIVAADYPDRVLSFGAVFTAPLRPFVLFTSLKALPVFLKKPPANETKEQTVDRLCREVQWVSGDTKRHEPTLRAELDRVYDRGRGDLAGSARQMDALLATASLVGRAERINRPTVVIHGSKDPLIRTACGKDLANIVPGAKLRVIPGMGHSIAEPVWPILLDELTANFAKAR